MSSDILDASIGKFFLMSLYVCMYKDSYNFSKKLKFPHRKVVFAQ